MAGENKVFLLHIDCTSELGCVRPLCHVGLYVWSRYRTSAMWVIKENLIFSLLSAYSSTLMATRNTLKPPNLVHNLHAT